MEQIISSLNQALSKQPLFTAAALVSLLLLAYMTYYRFLHPLARFPGPLTASISNGWKLWATWNDRMPEEIEKLHARYGPIVRIGPNDLSFNTPEAVTTIYKSSWAKGNFYEGFHSTQEHGLFGEMNVQVCSSFLLMLATLGHVS
jgi:hypothetical protein